MNKRVMVIAPHPDDETLGCGGTLLRHKHSGDRIYWLIATRMFEENGFLKEKIRQRDEEIKKVSEIYGFDSTDILQFPTTRLDEIPISVMVEAIGEIITKHAPHILYFPFPYDIHTDHKVVFDASLACTKWFRYPFIEKILLYETLSETEFGIRPGEGFRPNVYVDITRFVNMKLSVMSIYQSEIGSFPFPRSEVTIRALAELRGSTSGCQAAEAFMLLKEIQLG